MMRKLADVNVIDLSTATAAQAAEQALALWADDLSRVHKN